MSMGEKAHCTQRHPRLPTKLLCWPAGVGRWQPSRTAAATRTHIVARCGRGAAAPGQRQVSGDRGSLAVEPPKPGGLPAQRDLDMG